MIFDAISVKVRWEWWCRWNCALRDINARKKAFSVVSNRSPRRTETCAHVRTTSFSGMRSRQNGQLELRRRRREGQKDLHAAVSVGTLRQNSTDQNILPAAEMPELIIRNGEYWHHTLPFVEVSCSSILNLSLLFFFLYRSIKHYGTRSMTEHRWTWMLFVCVPRQKYHMCLCTTTEISHVTERRFAWALTVTLLTSNTK